MIDTEALRQIIADSPYSLTDIVLELGCTTNTLNACINNKRPMGSDMMEALRLFLDIQHPENIFFKKPQN